MALGKVSISEGSSTSFKRYIGVAPLKIIAVNPKKAELEKIYERELDKEPEYLGKTLIDGKEYEQVRLDFICSLEIPEGKEEIIKLPFYIIKKLRLSQTGKVQVCNIFGETTWVPKEDLETKTCSMSWFSTEGMRACYHGEESLIKFIKAYLNIPNKSYTDANGNLKTIDDEKDAYIQFEKIADLFKANYKEFQDIIKLLPEAKVKVCLGVRTNDAGNTYQDYFDRLFYKNAARTYKNLQKEIEEAKLNGAYSHTEFVYTDVTEYTVEATSFTNNNTASNNTAPIQKEEDDLPF